MLTTHRLVLRAPNLLSRKNPLYQQSPPRLLLLLNASATIPQTIRLVTLHLRYQHASRETDRRKRRPIAPAITARRRTLLATTVSANSRTYPPSRTMHSTLHGVVDPHNYFTHLTYTFTARPCQRCVKRGFADNCTEGHRKKAKYLLDDEELGAFVIDSSITL